MSKKQTFFKINTAYQTKKNNVTKAVALSTVILPLHFFVPGAKPIINKSINIVKNIINLYSKKDILATIFEELNINDSMLLTIIELLVSENYEFLNKHITQKNLGVSKIKFVSNDILIELTMDEIYKEWNLLLKRKTSLVKNFEKTFNDKSQLNTFPLAIIVLLEKLAKLQNHKAMQIPKYEGSKLSDEQYINLVNLMQSNILQKKSHVFREIIENTNKLLFPQQYTRKIIDKRVSIAETKLGGGLKFTFNHLSLLRDVYNFNSPSFTKNIYAMMYSKDLLAKNMVNDYMDYLLFTSIHDTDLPIFTKIYNDMDDNIFMDSCEQQLNIKKQTSSTVKVSSNLNVNKIHTNTLTIELNNKKLITISKQGTLDFSIIYVILSCIQKLKKYYLQILQSEIINMDNRIQYSDLKSDAVSSFVNNYLTKLTTNAKYNIFLELLIFNNAAGYNLMNKALLQYYCPINI